MKLGREFDSRLGHKKFPLSRASLVSPLSKLCAAHWCIIKMNKNKNKINLRNHEFVRKKQNGGWKVSDADWCYFSFYDPSWSEANFILFLFFLFNPSRSELIRSDFCTCLAKMFVCPVPKISHVIMKWCRRASHLGRFTLWNNGRRATQLSRFTLWHNRRWASQLAGKVTLWLNGRRAKQPGLMHAPN